VNKYKLGLVFGGQSAEHEISLLSAENVASSLNPDLYDLVYLYIDKQGKWTKFSQFPEAEMLRKTESNHFSISAEVLEIMQECDIVFPVLHGPCGEDGTIQGLFELINLPYAGCNYRSSAISMDKVLSKRLVGESGVRTAAFVAVKHYEWTKQKLEVCRKVYETLTFPVFVKAAHLGSSVGVYKVENPEELDQAVTAVFSVDNELLVEEAIVGRELEFALIGNEDAKALPPGEVLTTGAFYDYEKKYGAGGFKTVHSVDLPDEEIKKGMRLAETCYRAIGCDGMARVDFFYTPEGGFCFNEINPIPGFTSISLYPKLFEYHGVSFNELLDRLIILGLNRQRHKLRAMSIS